MNPITGEKKVLINGETYIMRFSWKALAEIETRHGDNPNLFNTGIVSDIASAGMRERHPEMTPEKIMELSPPLMPFVRDVQEALQWAYFGQEEVEPDEDKAVKKNPWMAGLYQHIVQLFRRE